MSSGPSKRGSTIALSVVTVVLGLMLIGKTLLAGGGPISGGVVLGVMLLLIGALRLMLATRRPTT